MLNDFLKTLKGPLMEQITGNADVDANKVEGIADVVGDTFKSGLADKFGSGQLGDLVGLLGSGGSKTAFAGSLVNDAVANLVSKTGLPKGVATTIANVAVPFVIEKFGSFAASKGKTGESGLADLLGDIAGKSVLNKLAGGLGKKFGF